MADDDLKACCAAAYSSDVVALLLGDSYHPGGTTLTRRLAGALGLTAQNRVLDVASGRGTTALLLADAYGVRVDGVDYSPAGVAAGALDERGHRRGPGAHHEVALPMTGDLVVVDLGGAGGDGHHAADDAPPARPTGDFRAAHGPG